eukprot:gene5963-8217_t
MPNKENEIGFTPEQYPGIGKYFPEATYSEELLIGYRWYDAMQVEPLFPFGHVMGEFELVNNGPIAGDEKIQVYIQYPASANEPTKQLRTFKKVHVKVPRSEFQIVSFSLTKRDCSIWDFDNNHNTWTLVGGVYTVYIGASSRDIRLQDHVRRITNLIENNSSCSNSFHRPDLVKESVKIATNLMAQQDISSQNRPKISERLAIMVLFSSGLDEAAISDPRMANRIDYLKCSLLKVKKHLMSSTPADVFIWTLPTNNKSIPLWFTPKEFPNMYIMEIPEDVWKIPCNIKTPHSQWSMSNSFGVGFYLMGRWRLTFSFDFVKEMGYLYSLQLDDDAIITQPIRYNLVERMSSHSFSIAVVDRHYIDSPEATSGLPEITKNWLTKRPFTPIGSLQQHGGTDRLSSSHWDRSVSVGYFILMSVDFWFNADVQDYLQTIFLSGGDIEKRWQEQGVIGMIKQVFIPRNKILISHFADHNRHNPKNFENWCK